MQASAGFAEQSGGGKEDGAGIVCLWDLGRGGIGVGWNKLGCNSQPDAGGPCRVFLGFFGGHPLANMEAFHECARGAGGRI